MLLAVVAVMINKNNKYLITTKICTLKKK